MRIVKHRERIERITYARHYALVDKPSCGLTFDSDAQGRVDVSKLNACARANHELAQDPAVYRDQGVVERHWSWVESAVGICDDCGAEVYLAHFTNECDCGADYNMSGQRLAPREQWGEETGESLADILQIP